MIEKFLLVGLKVDLPPVRDDNKLYWCSDTRELYKGMDLYTEAVRIVDALPDAMAQGVLYVLPSGEVKVFNGTDVVTVAKPYVDSTSGVLTADNTDDQVATAKMVYESIAQAVGAVAEGGELVNNIFSTKAGTVTVTKGAYVKLDENATFSAGTNYFKKVDDQYVLDEEACTESRFPFCLLDHDIYISSDEVDVAIKGVVVDPTYDASTRTITLPYADGTESLVINLGKDIFIDPTADNKYNTETGNIEVYLNDGSMTYEQVAAMMSQTSVLVVKLTNSAVYTANYTDDYFDANGAVVTVSDANDFVTKVASGLYVNFNEYSLFYPGVDTYYTLLGGEYQENNAMETWGGDLGNAASNIYNQLGIDGPIDMYIGTNAQTKIEIPASELVDIYTGGTHTDGSTTVTVSEDNVITASVNISAKEKNVLSKEADGLYVDAPTKDQHAEAVANIDALDVQLNGEEVVLKENGATTGATYTFNDNDTFMVDGVETEVVDQTALDAILADANQSVTVITSNIEDRLADTEAGVAANADAIAAVKATVDDGLYVQVEADAAYVAGTTYYKADAEGGYVIDESVVDEATFDTAKANGLYVLADDAIAALSAKIAQNTADIADNNDAIDAVSYVQCTTNTVFDANTTYFMVDTDGNFVEDTAIVDADTFATAVAAGTAFVKTTDVVKANESRIATIENALTWGTFA